MKRKRKKITRNKTVNLGKRPSTNKNVFNIHMKKKIGQDREEYKINSQDRQKYKINSTF